MPKVHSFDQRQPTHWATISGKEEVGKFFLAVFESLVSARMVKAIKFTWRWMRLRRKNREQTSSEMMTSSLAIQSMCLDLLREVKAMTSTFLEKQEYCQRLAIQPMCLDLLPLLREVKAMTITLLEKQEYCQREIETLRAACSLTDQSDLSGEGQSGTSTDNSSSSHARGTQSVPTPSGDVVRPEPLDDARKPAKKK